MAFAVAVTFNGFQLFCIVAIIGLVLSASTLLQNGYWIRVGISILMVAFLMVALNL